MSQRSILSVGVLLIGSYVAGLMSLMSFASYSFWAALLIAPILVALSIPTLARQARRERDRWLFKLLVAALILKMVGAIATYWVNFSFYQGVADANHYYQTGLALGEQFRQGIFHLDIHQYSSGTAFISLVTGVVLALVGPTKLGASLIFSWLGFWGLFFFYRAFVIAVPEGRTHQYAVLTFFMPTLLFWPSDIGKEAWMMLWLGLSALGMARILTGNVRRGLLPVVLGLWLAAIVRPHIAAAMAVAFAIGVLVRKPRKELGELAPVLKAIGLVAAIVVAVFLVVKANQFLTGPGLNVDQGLFNALSKGVERTNRGQSAFAPPILESPARAPVAIVTVLFRPVIFDAQNLQTLLAALEGTFLLVFTIIRLRWILASVRSMRRQPYVAAALAYTMILVAAFSVFANYGLLIRQRSQILPMFLIFLAIPPRGWRRNENADVSSRPVGRGAISARLLNSEERGP